MELDNVAHLIIIAGPRAMLDEYRITMAIIIIDALCVCEAPSGPRVMRWTGYVALYFTYILSSGLFVCLFEGVSMFLDRDWLALGLC